MFLDEEAAQKMTAMTVQGYLISLKPTDFRPDDDGERYIPFKYSSKDHEVALRGIDAAKRRKHCDDPQAILVAKMSTKAFADAVLQGSIKVFPKRKSIGFMYPLLEENYPSIKDKTLTIIHHKVTLYQG